MLTIQIFRNKLTIHNLYVFEIAHNTKLPVNHFYSRLCLAILDIFLFF